VPGLAGVVFSQTRTKVRGETHVAFPGERVALKQVNVVQRPPFFAEASKGILLRTDLSANPAKLEERSRMAVTEGFEPSIPFQV
jgi:hypothetical protein